MFRAYLNNDGNWNANDDNLANSNDNGRMTYPRVRTPMEETLYYKIYTWENLVFAWRKARKGKTKKEYVKIFEEDLITNLKQLQLDLMTETYFPKPLKTFILRDPKTRKISKADFRDRIVHHSLINIIRPIFEKSFIYDSCANQKGKGNLFALKRFDKFKRQVSKNNTRKCFVLKADIKHYFEEVSHNILINLLRKKISDEKVICLIMKILVNGGKDGKTMPLGNLTSQFFANVYLDKLDKFVKYQLKVKFYIRYVDDFVILDNSRILLEFYLARINIFLEEKLKLELHSQKSRIILLSRGVDFIGFRNFYHFRLLRKRNIQNIKNKIKDFSAGKISQESIIESFEGWKAYAKWANSYNIESKFIQQILKIKFPK